MTIIISPRQRFEWFPGVRIHHSYELAGEVVEVGVNVTNVAVGDRVAVEPGVACGPLRLLQKR
ncbi:hypothetical protein HMSSN036_18660 [Paenibacillus macerans]|nr:hypothetical protein HMSSN036_18660 [Paenibacillus macerans]